MLFTEQLLVDGCFGHRYGHVDVQNHEHSLKTTNTKQLQRPPAPKLCRNPMWIQESNVQQPPNPAGYFAGKAPADCAREDLKTQQEDKNSSCCSVERSIK